MENRNGLIVDAIVTQADGTAEPDAALLCCTGTGASGGNRRERAVSVGADKAYDTRDFVSLARELGVRPHVAQNCNRTGGSATDGRTTRRQSYAVSQRKRP